MSIHQTEEDYWQFKEEARDYNRKSRRLIILIIVLLVLFPVLGILCTP